jgi:cysteine-rich repeat protein
MRNSVTSFLHFLPAVALLCLLAVPASANHLHYIPITDTQFPENDPASPEYIPGWTIFDTYGETPLERWVIYSGDDTFTTFSNNSRTMEASVGSGTAEGIFDAPGTDDITNSKLTAFYEFEVFTLDTSGLQTIEVGLTDLINQIKWDEASGVISASMAGASDLDVGDVPRWSAHASLPLRLRIYYNFNDHVLTFVVIDDVLGASPPFSWSSPTVNPFQNFFGEVGGTDPDNLSIYPFALCEAQCGLTGLDWKMLNCDTVDGQVDIDSCLFLPGVGNNQIDPGETCEDGNTSPGDGCDENGQLEKIGWKCQQAIGMAGHKYANVRLKTLRKCRDRLNKGVTLFQDKAKTLALTDRSECPNEFRTAVILAMTGERVRKLVDAKCTDALVGALVTCGETVDEVVSPDGTAGCLVETHDAGVATLLTALYGG